MRVSFNFELEAGGNKPQTIPVVSPPTTEVQTNAIASTVPQEVEPISKQLNWQLIGTISVVALIGIQLHKPTWMGVESLIHHRKPKPTSTSGKYTLPSYAAGKLTMAAVGRRISRYRISSGYGPRSIGVGSRFHRGADLAAPTGTPLYLIALPGQSINVRCWWDSRGGGKVASFKNPKIGKAFDYLHLSACYEGNKKAGEVIAKVGATGVGTGAHLHLTQRNSSGAKEIPQEGFMKWAVTGRQP